MSSIFLILLLPVASQAEVKPQMIPKQTGDKSADKFTNEFVSKLVERAFREVPLHNALLDDSTLGKVNRLASSNSALLNRHGVFSNSVAASPLRTSASDHGCGVFCAATRDSKVSEDRRRALVALLAPLYTAATVGTVAMNPLPSLADDELLDGPQGLKYRDLEVGTGEAVSTGDKLLANYVLRLVTNNRQIDKRQNFKFTVGAGKVIKGWDVGVLGGGDMQPMKVGGSRQLIIPPQLAYGSKGAGCTDDPSGFNRQCKIPPDSELEFIVIIQGKER